jgi:hypothetical protein
MRHKRHSRRSFSQVKSSANDLANCAKSFVTRGGGLEAGKGYVAPKVTVTVAGWTEV